MSDDEYGGGGGDSYDYGGGGFGEETFVRAFLALVSTFLLKLYNRTKTMILLSRTGKGVMVMLP